MRKRKSAALWVVACILICVAIIWHVIDWNSTGMYLEMSGWTKTEKAYLTVLYNLGLMILWGITLGLLTKKITDLVCYKVDVEKSTDDGDNKFNER